MVKQIDKNEARLRRHRRVRGKISGTAARPRLDVFRSAKHIYAQLIDDEAGVTLAAASTLDKDFNGYGGNIDAATAVGKSIAKKALDKGITEVVVHGPVPDSPFEVDPEHFARVTTAALEQLATS